MTAQAGRFPLDVVMLSTAGDVLGSFSLTLKVERAAINNGKIATYTYAGVVEAIRKGLLEVYITDDGYLPLCRRTDSASVTSRNPAPSRNSSKIF